MSTFNKGDEVTVRATVVDSGSCCTDVTVQVAGHLFGPHRVGDVESSAVTLVKKAVPPLPKAGTVFKHSDVTGGVYVVLADGNTTYVHTDPLIYSSSKVALGKFKWASMDHSKVTVLR